MSCNFATTYWLLGDGADEEAKRWVAHEKHKRILWSSAMAVQIYEEGNYLAPALPDVPGFVVAMISHCDANYGVTLGISAFGSGGSKYYEEKE